MQTRYFLLSILKETYHGLEPIRDNGGNKTGNKGVLPIVDRFQSLVKFFKKESKTNQGEKTKRVC